MPALKRSKSAAALIPAVFILFFAGSLFGEVKVLQDFTLIDGTGTPASAHVSMIVDNGRIAWIGPAPQLKMPAGAEGVDATGKFVMPGVINLHGHTGNTIDLVQDAKFFTRDSIEKNLKAYSNYGVTSVFSMGTDQDLIFRIRDAQRAGRPAMARVFSAGQGFVFKGGYGGLAGVNHEVANVTEVNAELKNQSGKKVDIIKLWMDDHMGTQKKVPYDIGRAVAEGAHRLQLRATAHVFYLEDAKQLVDAGVNGLAHSVRDKPVDQVLIDSMKKHGTWMMAPTLSREASMFIFATEPPFLSLPFFTQSLTPKELQTLKSTKYQQSVKSDPDFAHYKPAFEVARKNLKTLADAGIRIAFGTDTGPPVASPDTSNTGKCS